MTAVMVSGIRMVMITCGGCGVVFCMPEGLHRKHHEAGPKGKGWHCPNGCVRVFSEGAVEKLRKEADALRRERDMAVQARARVMDERDQARRQAAAFKGVATKMRKRIDAGVCPCCNRHFANLHRHMASQHPGELAGQLRAIDGGRA